VREVEGTLFDVNEFGPWIILWVYDSEGRLHRFLDEFTPRAYGRGSERDLIRVASEFERRGAIQSVWWVERQEFYSGKTIEVMEFRIKDASAMAKFRDLALSAEDRITFYNCDIPPGQYYLSTQHLYPLCKLSVIASDSGQVLDLQTADEPLAPDYRIPEHWKTLYLAGEGMRQGARSRKELSLQFGGEEVRVRLSQGEEAIHTVNEVIERYNPDLVISREGDGVLFPALLRLADECATPLIVDRDRVPTYRKVETEGRTFTSYGRVYYRGPDLPLFGRIHIDERNSFTYKEAGLDGVIELARLARLPVQRAARTTPGTAMSAIELDHAIRHGILVPWRKSEPERRKTALELLRVDKGGLVFLPKLGTHESVVEIDFASQYPSIMTESNISPETMFCDCCENSSVPEAGYRVCEKREGLIPQVLRPLVKLRREYKQLIQAEGTTDEERERYTCRRSAVKWALVSCFGYMGYRNARFGRIEAHEAITAWGRETLLRAKEIAEDHGYRLVHAIVDSLWLVHDQLSEEEVERLCARITEETKVEMVVEGYYRWIVFPPSKQNHDRPVPACYFGLFSDGRLKVRGLMCRKGDTPEIVREVQTRMLEKLMEAETIDECKKLVPDLVRILQSGIAEVHSGTVERDRLLVRRTLTRDPADYVMNTQVARAARELEAQGLKVHPGEKISFVIKPAGGGKKRNERTGREHTSGEEYSVTEYVKLLTRAAGEILEPLCGVNAVAALLRTNTAISA
jgi:DNA polymerase-2